MVVGSSVSRKECDKVFLKCHIWSLDHQCRGKNVTKFSWSAIYSRWIVSVTETMWRSFPGVPYTVVGSSVSRKTCDEVFLECHIRLLDRQCHGKHVTKFSSCTRSSNMDKEALLRRRRELYQQRRQRETPEEREVRSRRREYITGNLHIQDQVPTTFLPHACMHAFSGSPLDAVSICLVKLLCIFSFSLVSTYYISRSLYLEGFWARSLPQESIHKMANSKRYGWHSYWMNITQF